MNGRYPVRVARLRPLGLLLYADSASPSAQFAGVRSTAAKYSNAIGFDRVSLASNAQIRAQMRLDDRHAPSSQRGVRVEFLRSTDITADKGVMRTAKPQGHPPLCAHGLPTTPDKTAVEPEDAPRCRPLSRRQWSTGMGAGAANQRKAFRRGELQQISRRGLQRWCRSSQTE